MPNDNQPIDLLLPVNIALALERMRETAPLLPDFVPVPVDCISSDPFARDVEIVHEWLKEQRGQEVEE